MHHSSPSRRLPVGTEVLPDGRAHFRVWAPGQKAVSVVVTEDAGMEHPAGEFPLEAEANGYFSGVVEARAGQHYKYRLARGLFPDPVSRFQPIGPHGASQIVDPGAFEWRDAEWRGISREGQVIYEMHVGTFTLEGTWEAAGAQLEELASLGITVLEVMPVSDFPGRYGWGYDGVNLFAPTRLYGDAEGFRRFVDRAHGLGLGVILDVVYNHLGPDGNYLVEFAANYFHPERKTEWGDALNFDGPDCGPVREFFVSNARYWIEEFHLDGLRLDATQQIFDDSPEHILAEVGRAVRAAGAPRDTYLVAENEPQHTRLVRPVERGGYALDALWNDDFHHSTIVALAGRREAYYTDYLGSAQEFVSAAKWGYLYQGQRYKWQKKRRGTPAFDLHAANFVTFIQNHDQIANSLWGKRLHELTSAGRLRAATALLLLGPGTPMLFQGQEFAASTPFLYFADHNPELARAVAEGRAEFLRQFPSINSAQAIAVLADPEKEDTFQRCKLDFSDRERNAEIYRLHRDLLTLRRTDPLLGKVQPGKMDGAVLAASTFVLRFFGREQDDRVLLVNFGPALQLDPAPEPLLAPPDGHRWRLAWSSEEPCYGGSGTPPIESEENWHITAHAAAVLVPEPVSAAHDPRESRP